ncbi:MAG: glycosyltransferase [Verrucomicrobiaceae bacterium]|nr:glycosyltransferase [Verrucomicrobiaceae bacterium]
MTKTHALSILHVIPSLSPRRGGPTDAILGLCPKLERLGVNSTIVTTDDDLDRHLQVPLMREITHEGCRVIFFPRRDGLLRIMRDFSYSPELRRWLEEHITDFDLVHVHALFSYAPSLAMQIAREAEVPYICRPLGLLGEWALQQKTMRKRVFLRLFDAENLEHASAIEYSSPQEALEGGMLGLHNPASTIPLGFNPVPEVPDARRNLGEKLGLDPGRLVILFLSRVHPKKGLDLLIEACARLPRDQFYLLIAGSGEAAHESAIRKLIKARGIEEQTRWLGFVEHDAKNEALRGCDVFVLPSHSESFGIAVAEAMSAARGVIVSRMVPVADWVRDADAGWVVEPDRDSVHAALSDVLKNRLQLEERGQRGAAAAARMTYECTARQLLDLYKDCQPPPADVVGLAGRPLRVLHVIPSLSPSQGGPSYAMPLMARALAAEGLHVDIVTTNDDGRGRRLHEQPLGELLPREGCRVAYFPKQTEFYKVSTPLLRWLWRHVREYDVIHVHAIFSFASAAAIAAASDAGVPCIVRPLGVLNTWGMTQRRRLTKKLSFNWLDRPLINSAAAMHYTSVQERDEAARLALAPAPEVIPLGVDLHEFDELPSENVFLDQFPAAAGRQRIFFLSRIDVKKGIELLLHAYAKARSFFTQPACLVIAGRGQPAYEEQLRTLATRLGIASDIVWTGHLQGHVKLSAFAAATLFVLPSQSENFGIALLEAMAAGCPCLSTPEVALATDVAPSQAVELVPQDIDAWSAALLRMLGDPEYAHRLGLRAHEVARTTYSLEAMGRALHALYQRLARR